MSADGISSREAPPWAATDSLGHRVAQRHRRALADELLSGAPSAALGAAIQRRHCTFARSIVARGVRAAGERSQSWPVVVPAYPVGARAASRPASAEEGGAPWSGSGHSGSVVVASLKRDLATTGADALAQPGPGAQTGAPEDAKLLPGVHAQREQAAAIERAADQTDRIPLSSAPPERQASARVSDGAPASEAGAADGGSIGSGVAAGSGEPNAVPADVSTSVHRSKASAAAALRSESNVRRASTPVPQGDAASVPLLQRDAASVPLRMALLQTKPGSESAAHSVNNAPNPTDASFAAEASTPGSPPSQKAASPASEQARATFPIAGGTPDRRADATAEPKPSGGASSPNAASASPVAPVVDLAVVPAGGDSPNSAGPAVGVQKPPNAAADPPGGALDAPDAGSGHGAAHAASPMVQRVVAASHDQQAIGRSAWPDSSSSRVPPITAVHVASRGRAEAAAATAERAAKAPGIAPEVPGIAEARSAASDSSLPTEAASSSLSLGSSARPPDAASAPPRPGAGAQSDRVSRSASDAAARALPTTTERDRPSSGATAGTAASAESAMRSLGAIDTAAAADPPGAAHQYPVVAAMPEQAKPVALAPTQRTPESGSARAQTAADAGSSSAGAAGAIEMAHCSTAPLRPPQPETAPSMQIAAAARYPDGSRRDPSGFVRGDGLAAPLSLADPMPLSRSQPPRGTGRAAQIAQAADVRPHELGSDPGAAGETIQRVVASAAAAQAEPMPLALSPAIGPSAQRETAAVGGSSGASIRPADAVPDPPVLSPPPANAEPVPLVQETPPSQTAAAQAGPDASLARHSLRAAGASDPLRSAPGAFAHAIPLARLSALPARAASSGECAPAFEASQRQANADRSLPRWDGSGTSDDPPRASAAALHVARVTRRESAAASPDTAAGGFPASSPYAFDRTLVGAPAQMAPAGSYAGSRTALATPEASQRAAVEADAAPSPDGRFTASHPAGALGRALGRALGGALGGSLGGALGGALGGPMNGAHAHASESVRTLPPIPEGRPSIGLPLVSLAPSAGDMPLAHRSPGGAPVIETVLPASAAARFTPSADGAVPRVAAHCVMPATGGRGFASAPANLDLPLVSLAPLPPSQPAIDRAPAVGAAAASPSAYEHPPHGVVPVAREAIPDPDASRAASGAAAAPEADFDRFIERALEALMLRLDIERERLGYARWS